MICHHFATFGTSGTSGHRDIGDIGTSGPVPILSGHVPVNSGQQNRDIGTSHHMRVQRCMLLLCMPSRLPHLAEIAKIALHRMRVFRNLIDLSRCPVCNCPDVPISLCALRALPRTFLYALTLPNKAAATFFSAIEHYSSRIERKLSSWTCFSRRSSILRCPH